MNEPLGLGKYIGRVFDDRGIVVQNIEFEVKDVAPPELHYPAQDQVVDFFAFEEMEFRWNENDAAKRFQVQLSLNENFGTLLMDVTVEGNTLKFPPLSGGTYFWRVRPETGDDNHSLWSETSIFHLQREKRNRLSLTKIEPKKQLVPDFEILVASKTVATRSTYSGVGLDFTRRCINNLPINGPTFGWLNRLSMASLISSSVV